MGVLLDYVLLMASRENPAFGSINALTPHLIALVKLNPITAATHFIDKITLMQKNLARGLAKGSTNPQSRTLPGAPELVLLRLLGSVWSTSDFSHPVVAPAVLLMGQYLGHGRVRRLRDLASGLMLCSLVAQASLLLQITWPAADQSASLRQSQSDSSQRLSTSLRLRSPP